MTVIAYPVVLEILRGHTDTWLPITHLFQTGNVGCWFDPNSCGYQMTTHQSAVILSKAADHGASAFTAMMSLRIETVPKAWESSIFLFSGREEPEPS